MIYVNVVVHVSTYRLRGKITLHVTQGLNMVSENRCKCKRIIDLYFYIPYLNIQAKINGYIQYN